MVANLTQTEDLMAAAWNTDDNAEIASEVTADLTINQNLDIAQGDIIELQIVKTGSPTSLSSARVKVYLFGYMRSA